LLFHYGAAPCVAGATAGLLTEVLRGGVPADGAAGMATASTATLGTNCNPFSPLLPAGASLLLLAPPPLISLNFTARGALASELFQRNSKLPSGNFLRVADVISFSRP